MDVFVDQTLVHFRCRDVVHVLTRLDLVDRLPLHCNNLLLCQEVALVFYRVFITILRGRVSPLPSSRGVLLQSILMTSGEVACCQIRCPEPTKLRTLYVDLVLVEALPLMETTLVYLIYLT